MKILVITNFLPKYSIEFYEELNKKFLNQKINLYLIADTKSNIDVNQFKAKTNLKIIHLKLKSIGIFNFRLKLIKKIKEINPSKVVFYGNPRDLSVYYGLLFCKLKNIETYVYGMFHRIGKNRLFSKISYLLFYFLSRACFTYGKKGLTNLKNLGLDQKKIHIIGNAVNEKKIKIIKKKLKNKKKIFKSLKVKFPSLNSNLILQVVRMSAIKKPLLLVEAAKILVKKERDISFIIVGEGILFKEFCLLVSKYKLENYFIFLKSMYDEKQLANWFLISKCMVVPACIGLSIHHSFAYGLPVITDDDYETQSSESEILKNNFNGLKYKSNNPTDLSKKINLILKYRNLQKKMSKNALNTSHNNKLEDKVDKFTKALNLPKFI
jgi:glycosyltransferase involved in cell wall biosynthesis